MWPGQKVQGHWWLAIDLLTEVTFFGCPAGREDYFWLQKTAWTVIPVLFFFPPVILVHLSLFQLRVRFRHVKQSCLVPLNRVHRKLAMALIFFSLAPPPSSWQVVLLRRDMHEFIRKAPFSEGSAAHLSYCRIFSVNAPLFFFATAVEMVRRIRSPPRQNISGSTRHKGTGPWRFPDLLPLCVCSLVSLLIYLFFFSLPLFQNWHKMQTTAVRCHREKKKSQINFSAATFRLAHAP